ncbi:hypothetical protein M514_00571 [Trichuris suis]|uniref:Sugar phosphate transporter domain-containing protein n=1 Tax=Trichuris suis TaxID=68888 RepID=A0A085MVK6_9BILA|nr:hypothetical protein M514_00571 [Trichuris suis]
MNSGKICSRENACNSLLFLAFATSGTCNTIFAKWMDMTVALERRFYHPFIQVMFTYIGESLCFLLFLLISKQASVRHKEFSWITYSSLKIHSKAFILFIPTGLDYLSTTLNYVSLSMTSPSSYQMLRGSLIVFTSLLSFAFLGRSLSRTEWLGIALVTFGMVLVGLSDSPRSSSAGAIIADLNRIRSGDLLVVTSQTMKAVQLTLEENFMNEYNLTPLVLTSTEGCQFKQCIIHYGVFGLILSAIIAMSVYFVRVPQYMTTDPEQRLENIKDAFYQAMDSSTLLRLILCFIVSSAASGMCSAAVTKRFGATTRVICDAARIFGVWMMSIVLRWQAFIPSQLLGFGVLLLGAMLYSGINCSQKLKMLRGTNENFEDYKGNIFLPLKENHFSHYGCIIAEEAEAQNAHFV